MTFSFIITDKMFPVYGFGAKVRQPDGSFSPVQHCFPVYAGGLEVQGVPGIMKAYSDCLAHVTLSGKHQVSFLIVYLLFHPRDYIIISKYILTIAFFLHYLSQGPTLFAPIITAAARTAAAANCSQERQKYFVLTFITGWWFNLSHMSVH